MGKTTVSMDNAQLRFLRRLLLQRLLEDQMNVRRGTEDHGCPEEELHEDIRIASTLVALLPEPHREGF